MAHIAIVQVRHSYLGHKVGHAEDFSQYGFVINITVAASIYKVAQKVSHSEMIKKSY